MPDMLRELFQAWNWGTAAEAARLTGERLITIHSSPNPAYNHVMEDSQVIWAIVLIATAFLLIFAEVLVPSGGVLGFLAAGSLIGGIVLLFQVDTTLGLVGAIVTLIATPFVMGYALKIWPNTPIGRRLILQGKTRDTNEPKTASTEQKDLTGATGKALTDLRPIGTCMIDGQRIDCLADEGVIEAGQGVRVIGNDGMQVKVCVDEQSS